jgi:hypothetical protein
MENRNLMRQYMNLKTSRNLTDHQIAKIIGVTKWDLVELKKEWELPLRKGKDNMQGVSEMDFKTGARNGLSRRLILRRVRDYGWEVERAIREPLDESKRNNRRKTENE